MSKLRWLHRPDTTFTGLIIATVVAVIYMGQLAYMRDSVQLTERALRIDQRAWVGLTDTEIIRVDESEFRFRVVVINAGKTPALNFRSRGQYRLIHTNQPFDPESIIKASEPVKKGDMLQPGVRRMIPVAIETITPSHIDALKSGAGAFYVFGELNYDDIFGESHVTHFCLQLAILPGQPPGFTHCDQYEDGN